jgi:hypothetical protein
MGGQPSEVPKEVVEQTKNNSKFKLDVEYCGA